MRSRVDGTFEFEDKTVFAFSCGQDASFDDDDEFHWISWAMRGPDEERVVYLAQAVQEKLLWTTGDIKVVDDEYAQGWAAIFGRTRWSQERVDRLLAFTEVAKENGWFIP